MVNETPTPQGQQSAEDRPRAYYEDSAVTIYNGDCREILPIKNAAAVVTDPPFGTQELIGGYGRRQNWNNGDGYARTITGDRDLTVLAEAWPLITGSIIDGWIASFFSPRKLPLFIVATSAREWFGELIWDKGPGLGRRIRYSHESIAVFRIGEPPQPDCPILSVLRSGAIAGEHPHEKPVPVLARIIEFLTADGETVIDPFCGSGNTLRAAKNLGRKAIGIEIEERYCEIAAKRMAQEVLQFA